MKQENSGFHFPKSKMNIRTRLASFRMSAQVLGKKLLQSSG
jgi:hypothetical protein